MANLNQVFLIGNLTRDVELRFTPNGAAVATIGLAVNHNYKDSSGEWKQEPNFFTVTAWGKTAENANEHLKKGSPILVEGRLRWRSWETDAGEKRSVVEVVANRIQFLHSKPKDGNSGSTSGGGHDEDGFYDDIPF